jgi:hypothetical protein
MSTRILTVVSELHSGDRAVFDPLIGPERVAHVEELSLANGVRCVHLNVAARDGVPRFIVRASHEPVVLVGKGGR